MTTTYILLAIVSGIVIYLVYMTKKIKNMPSVPDSESITKLDGKNIDHHLKNGIVLVDFWAAWCMPCKMLAPVLNEVADSSKGKARICKLNIEENPQLASRFSVRNIPTMIIFKNGKEVDRIVGVKTKDFILNKLEWVKMK